MKKYDTLVIGSSFASVGFALECENTLIAEQTEMLDTEFYLPMVGFERREYAPSTTLGAELSEIFREQGIFRENQQNVNAFEIALCRFAERSEAYR